MPAFKTRAGCGKISNFGYDFNEVDGTPVDDADVVERLRNHFQFEEVVELTEGRAESGTVKRETMPAPVATEAEPVPASEPVASEPVIPGYHPKRKPGRQPYPRDENGNPIKPVKTDG